MTLKEHMRLSLQSERDKQIWTDVDMWKAGFIGAFIGFIVGVIVVWTH